MAVHVDEARLLRRKLNIRPMHITNKSGNIRLVKCCAVGTFEEEFTAFFIAQLLTRFLGVVTDKLSTVFATESLPTVFNHVQYQSYVQLTITDAVEWFLPTHMEIDESALKMLIEALSCKVTQLRCIKIINFPDFAVVLPIEDTINYIENTIRVMTQHLSESSVQTIHARYRKRWNRSLCKGIWCEVHSTKPFVDTYNRGAYDVKLKIRGDCNRFLKFSFCFVPTPAEKRSEPPTFRDMLLDKFANDFATTDRAPSQEMDDRLRDLVRELELPLTVCKEILQRSDALSVKVVEIEKTLQKIEKFPQYRAVINEV